MKRKKPLRKKSKNLLAIAKRKAWSAFSEFIRRREADFYGITECFTCGTKGHWKDMQAGHFKHGKLDFDPMNINVQCIRCNYHLSGHLDQYALKLIEKYGLEKVQELNIKASMAVVEKMTIEEYEAIYRKYKEINESRDL